MHKTFIFFVSGSGEVELIPQQRYVRLVRGEQSAGKWAASDVRVADWYVEVAGTLPLRVENETYSFLRFDDTGKIEWPGEDHRPYTHDRIASGMQPCNEESARFSEKAKRVPHQGQEVGWIPTPTERKTLYETMCRAAKEGLSDG